MEQQLKSRGFVRIHRSAIVRIQAISEMRALDNGEYRVCLRCGTKLRLSRNYRDTLRRCWAHPSEADLSTAEIPACCEAYPPE